MIGEITDNIVYALSKFGIRAKDDVQELRDIITTELSKYEISRRETALVVHDRTDFDIICYIGMAINNGCGVDICHLLLLLIKNHCG